MPTSAIEGQFWYCTENVEDYKKGYIYEYQDGEWVETSWNRKNLEDLNSLFKVVSIREDDDTRKNTVSGRVIRYTPTGDADETHIFNMTNRVQYKDYEPNIIAHCKIKNSTETGTVMLILAFTDFDFETEPLNNIELIVESGYEPAVILTPDDCQNMSEIEINVKMPKKTDFLPVVTGTTAPTDTTKLWLDTSVNLIKEYIDGTWTIKQTMTTAYDETTRKIWTYRPFFASYYETSKNFDNFEFRSIYEVIYYLGGLNIISSTTEPTPVKGAYWYNPTTNVVKRAKYDGTYFIEWVDTNTTLESLPCPPFPTNVQVPMKGYFEIADLKIEYNNTKTRWAQYEGENYSKNYKWDERGMYIESGQNIMYIDEDEILATYKSNAIFFIKEDLSYLKYLQTEKIQIGNYFLEEKNINNKNILCLY